MHLEWGAEVNVFQKTTDWGALMLAMLSGKVGVAQKLVEQGADPDQVKVLAKTAFELSQQLKQRDVKAILDSIITLRPQPGMDQPRVHFSVQV